MEGRIGVRDLLDLPQFTVRDGLAERSRGGSPVHDRPCRRGVCGRTARRIGLDMQGHGQDGGVPAVGSRERDPVVRARPGRSHVEAASAECVRLQSPHLPHSQPQRSIARAQRELANRFPALRVGEPHLEDDGGGIRGNAADGAA